jgi:hypothetical protein
MGNIQTDAQVPGNCRKGWIFRGVGGIAADDSRAGG